MAKQYFVSYDQKLFDLGDKCGEIFMVLNGIIDIVLTDGFDNNQVLDVCGRGSMMGFNFILSGERWIYRAINHSNDYVHVLSIKRELLLKYVESHKSIKRSIE